MADRYYNTVQFTGLVVGVPTSLPHDLNWLGRGQTPHYVAPNQPGFTVTADDTDVTVTRQSGAPDNVDVFCEVLHTIVGAFGADDDLPVRPFVAAGASSGGGGSAGVEVFDPVQTVTWYVRPGGSDGNDGTSPATAFATIQRAWEELRTNVFGLIQRIDITGMKGANAITKTDGQLLFPAIVAGVINDLDATATGPDNLFSQQPLQYVAEMDEILAVTIAGTSQDAVTNLATITVNEALTPNAHVGQMLIGSGPFEHGVIVSNTGNDLVLATNNTTFTGPVAIYEYGAEIQAGDSANFFTSSGSLMQVECGLLLSGIKFSSTADSKSFGLAIYSTNVPVVLQQCDFAGLDVNGPQATTMDCNYIHAQGGNGGWSLTEAGAAAVQSRHSFYDNLQFIGWDTPWVILLNGWFEAPQDPVGRQHGLCSRLGLENVEVQNAAGIGVRSRHLDHTSMLNVRIANSASHAAEFLGGVGAHVMDNVQGAGNGGFGARLLDGAQLNAQGGTGVTGGSGDVDLGGSGATAWGAAPATDVGAANPEFCRLF